MIDAVRYLLLKSDWSDCIQDMHGLPIPFDHNWKSILVDMSGGADSALLNFLLADYITTNKLDTKIHIFANIRGWPNIIWQQPNIRKIFNIFREMFPNIDYQFHNAFTPYAIERGSIGNIIPHQGKLKSGDELIGGEFTSYLGYTHNIDAKFSSSTNNPEELRTDRAPSNRNHIGMELKTLINIKRDQWIRGRRMVYIDPFMYYTKDVIVKKYIELGKIDLFNETRSCEGSLDQIRQAAINENLSNTGEFLPDVLKDYVEGQYIPVCGVCWWCIEREWAKKKNNL